MDNTSTPVKMSKMSKSEYDSIIENNVISRIAFSGKDLPYVAPFLYVFDKKHLYFLSTRYGKKIKLFVNNPNVSVEIEEINPDMSSYRFITLQGKLMEVSDVKLKENIRRKFVSLIQNKKISPNSMYALGYLPSEKQETIVSEDRTMVWKLTEVNEIVALKND